MRINHISENISWLLVFFYYFWSNRYYLGALLFCNSKNFYNSKNLNCFGALSFFKDLFIYFREFWSQIGVVILVTPKQEMERKSECSFFALNLKWSKKPVWTKIHFLASNFLFRCGNFALIFTVFTTRRWVFEKSFFLINFIGVILWSGKWNAWKNLDWFWGWTKVKSGAKREWFLFIPLFLREREIDVWKNFL